MDQDLESPVDVALVELTNPAAFGRKRLSTAKWTATSPKDRGKCKDNYMKEGQDLARNLVDAFGYDEQHTPKKDLAALIDKEVRPLLIDPGTPGQELTLDTMSAVHTMGACGTRACMAVLGEVMVGAGIEDPEDIGDLKSCDDERRRVALKVLAGRVMDVKVATENNSAMVKNTLVTEILKSCYATPTVILSHIEPFLEKHGSMIFPCERIDSDLNRRLVTIRFLRVVCGLLKCLPPQTAARNLRMQMRKIGKDVTTAEEMEAVIMQFVQLGEDEFIRREKDRDAERSKKPRRGFSGNVTGAESGEESGVEGLGIGGAVTGAESSEGEEDMLVVIGPERSLWRAWSAADLAKYVMGQSTMAWEAVGAQTKLDMLGSWKLDGSKLDNATTHGWPSHQLDLTAQMGIKDQLALDVAMPILRALVRGGAKKASFASSAKAHDGLGGDAEATGALSMKFGRSGRDVSGADIKRYPSKRTAWHGLPVMWLERNPAAAADNGNGDPSPLMLERVGVLTSSKNVNTAGCMFLRQPANRDIDDSWVDVDQAVAGLKTMQEYIDTRQGQGSAVDMLSLLSDVSDQESRVATTKGPKGERKKYELKEIKEVLDEAAARGHETGDNPTAFTSSGIQSGTDQRTYLCAVNLGGKSLRNIAEHEAEAECLRLTRLRLLKFDCCPSNINIIEIQNFSLTMTNLGCLNPVKKELRMVSPDAKTKKTIIVQKDGQMEVEEVECDGRKQKSIVNKAMADFALRRCHDIWVLKHGKEYGNTRLLEFYKMFDDVMEKTVASDSIKPVAEIMTLAWEHMAGALLAATRRAQAAGTMQHAGFELSTISAIPQDWAMHRAEIILECRLEWVDRRCSAGQGQGKDRKGGRGRIGDRDAPPKGGGNSGQSEVEKAALEKHNFGSVDEAKRDFLKTEENRSKCWWACSPVGKMLGGCPFPDCKYASTHPKKGGRGKGGGKGKTKEDGGAG
jgi:hypothetical protein